MNKRNLKAIDLGRCLWHLDQLGLHTTAFVEILSLANCFQSSAMQVVVSFPRLFVKLIWDWYGLVEVESSCPRQLWGLVSYFSWFVCRDYAVGFAGSRWEGLLFSSPDTQSIKICRDHSHRHRTIHCTPHEIQMIRCMYGICLEFFKHLHFFSLIIMPQNHQKPILRLYLTLNLFMSLFFVYRGKRCSCVPTCPLVTLDSEFWALGAEQRRRSQSAIIARDRWHGIRQWREYAHGTHSECCGILCLPGAFATAHMETHMGKHHQDPQMTLDFLGAMNYMSIQCFLQRHVWGAPEGSKSPEYMSPAETYYTFTCHWKWLTLTSFHIFCNTRIHTDSAKMPAPLETRADQRCVADVSAFGRDTVSFQPLPWGRPQ